VKLPISFEAFDSCYGFCCGSADGDLARSAWRTAKQDGTRAALPFAASVFGARQSEFVAQRREKRRIRFTLHRVMLAIDFKANRLRHYDPSGSQHRFSCVAVPNILPLEYLTTE
jgi:hypothetical protein